MARNVVLRVCEGDPACDRAREFVTRMARELGLDLEVRVLDLAPGDPLPQVVLWDGTPLDGVDDEAKLRDAVSAKIWSEDATAGAAGAERDAQFTREEKERNAERERDARKLPRRKGPILREVSGEDPSQPADRGRPSRRPASAPPPPTPVLLRGGRRARWDVLARVARKVRAGGLPVLFLVPFVVAIVTLGSREPPDDPGPSSEAPAVEAPPLSLPTLDGFRFELGQQRGRAVLLVPFDARKANRDALLALGAEAEKAHELSRGDARIVAIGVGEGVAELRTALHDMPFGLTIAVDVGGEATRAFASGGGHGAGWWLVDRAGRVVGRGGRPGPDAFAALLASARGARARP